MKPIAPDEVGGHKRKVFPSFVFDAFNFVIASHNVNGRSEFTQDEVINKIIELGRVKRDQIFSHHWLDVEEAYKDEGWTIEYDKPGYNESYPASFIFKKNKDKQPRQKETFYGGELLRLQVKQGDHFVIMFQEKLPREHVERLTSIWKEFVEDEKAKVLILDGGAKLGVFNVDAAQQPGGTPVVNLEDRQ